MREANCKTCGRKILWIRTDRGQNVPVEPDEMTVFTTPGTLRYVGWRPTVGHARHICPISEQRRSA